MSTGHSDICGTSSEFLHTSGRHLRCTEIRCSKCDPAYSRRCGGRYPAEELRNPHRRAETWHTFQRKLIRCFCSCRFDDDTISASSDLDEVSDQRATESSGCQDQFLGCWNETDHSRRQSCFRRRIQACRSKGR